MFGRSAANRFVGVGAMCLVLACTPGRPAAEGTQRGASVGDDTQALQSAGPKRITAAILGNTRTFSNRIERSSAGSTPGSEEMEELVNAGLTVLDGRGELRPLLAEAVPMIENGNWRVFPDGRMETTWKLKSGAAWHDGTPFTSDDLAFTLTVMADQDLRIFREVAYDSVERVDAPDSLTVTVAWSRPYISADALFTRVRAQPLPKHILERPFGEDKAGFLELAYWNREFVGLGPFKVRDWVPGSYTILTANDRYILGRPKLDEIEVRFIADQNALIANILAGGIDVTLGRNMSLEQATQVRENWRDGRMELGAYTTWISIYPQFINPNPAVIGNLTFRRAIYAAIDRQAMADTLMLGMVPIAHSIISPLEPIYKEIEGSIVRYEFDPRRATQIVESLGYSRGTDGLFRDASAQILMVPTQTSQGNALQEKSMFAVADYIERIGIAVEQDVVPPQARSDLARRAARPGLEVQKQPAGMDALNRYYANSTPLPENNYTGNNRARYQSAELDALLDRFFATIPRTERAAALGQIAHHFNDQLNTMSLIYDVDPLMVSNRLTNVGAANGELSSVAWNAHEWGPK